MLLWLASLPIYKEGLFGNRDNVNLCKEGLALLTITERARLITDSLPSDSLLVVSGRSVVTQEELQHYLPPNALS